VRVFVGERMRVAVHRRGEDNESYLGSLGQPEWVTEAERRCQGGTLEAGLDFAAGVGNPSLPPVKQGRELQRRRPREQQRYECWS